MLVEQLTRFYDKCHKIPCYSIGSHRVPRTSKQDYSIICNFLVLWCGILLDFDVWLSTYVEERPSMCSRIVSILDTYVGASVDFPLGDLLEFLDHLDDELIAHLSTDEPFKEVLLFRTKAPTQFGVIKGIVQQGCWAIDRHEVPKEECVSLIHQVLAFGHKLDIERPDLEDDAYASFFEFEETQGSRDCLLDDHDTAGFIEEMNSLARKHLGQYKPYFLFPHHGPGAVSTKGVRTKYQKYLGMKTDVRINYLLAKNDLGQMADYNPWVSSQLSDRTSRFVAVPKTWKKLRGISAEPVELQFYQQAIFRFVDEIFLTDRWWRSRVNLHDQARSRELALLGSIHGGYATIDLSAASDSVSLELVKRVFKGTPLLYWLLGTRSTHTTCNGRSVRLGKFSPMGSACCFPTECIIFTLAAQVASDRTRSDVEDISPTIRVFGDDIIVDWYSAPLLCDYLEKMGFSVNRRKTYLSGSFREACGVEAYQGHHIEPLRFKSLSGDMRSWRPRLEEIATAISYCNSCYDRGLHLTREFLIGRLLNCRIVCGHKPIALRRLLPFTLDGQRGTLKSHYGSNFNLVSRSRSADAVPRQVPYYGYPEMQQLCYHLRARNHLYTDEISSLIDSIDYCEWLIRHQSDSIDTDDSSMDEIHFLDELCSPIFDSHGLTIVPTIRWVPKYPKLLSGL